MLSVDRNFNTESVKVSAYVEWITHGVQQVTSWICSTMEEELYRVLAAMAKRGYRDSLIVQFEDMVGPSNDTGDASDSNNDESDQPAGTSK